MTGFTRPDSSQGQTCVRQPGGDGRLERDRARAQGVITLAALLAAGLIVRAEEKAAAPKDTYPLKTCVVSDEELGSMDEMVKYTYKGADGKEREVRFCCKKCIKKFQKDPEPYLKKLDEAAAKAATK